MVILHARRQAAAFIRREVANAESKTKMLHSKIIQ